MARQVILVITAMMCTVITVMALATLSRIIKRKFPYQEHHATMTGHIPNHITTMTIGTDPSPFITDVAKEEASASQDHTTDPTVEEAPATIRGIHSAPLPTTKAAHDTHLPKDALGDTLTRACHTGTTGTHLQHITLPTGVTLMTILRTKAGLV